MTSLVNVIRACSEQITKKRTISDVMMSTVSEIGELADEIAVETGFSYKVAGPDGVLGEAVDSLICILDLIYTYNPAITEDELIAIATVKLDKWRRAVDVHESAKQQSHVIPFQ